MSVVEEQTSPAVPAGDPVRPRRRRLPHPVDVAAPLGFLSLALFVMWDLWRDPAGRVLYNNPDDHGVFLAFVAHGERVLFHGAHPFWETQLNAPHGVNMMANTSMLALTLPIAPITHWFGSAVGVVLLLTLGLSGTAAAWYWVLSRHVVRNRTAAVVGGLWCGFAPAMMSHASAHINFVAQFVVPFIVWRALKLREPGRAVRNGVALGLLVVVQVFINEEILLFTALALGVFVLAYAAWDRSTAAVAWRPMLAGLGVTAAVAVPLLAYPLWFQFFGPGHYRGLPFPPDLFVTDLFALGAYARESLAGDPVIAERLSTSTTEENAFFGVPLLIVLVAGVVLTRRWVAARAAAVTGLVFVIFGLGPELQVNGAKTGVPMPFALVGHLPLLDLVSITRFTMIASTVIGVLLAYLVARAAELPRPRGALVAAAVTAALVPVAPTPLPVFTPPAVPAFISDGIWRQYVRPGRTLVPVPLPEVTTGRQGQRWAGLSNLAFAVPRSYFLGPVNPPDDVTGAWNAPWPPTAAMLAWADRNNSMPRIGEQQRREIRADLAFWKADVVVLADVPSGGVLRASLTDLLGREPQRIGDAWVWDVRGLT